MSVILFIVIFGIGTTLAEVSGPHCLHCQNVRNSSECANKTTCPVGEMCQATAFSTNKGIFYSFGCSSVKVSLYDTRQMCHYSQTPHVSSLGLIGRRRFLEGTKPPQHPQPVGAHVELCLDCCPKHQCNAFLCPKNHFVNPVQTLPTPDLLSSATTKPITTSQPTTTEAPGDPNCRDLEEDGIKCSVLYFAEICHDTSRLGQFLRRKKCPKTCGLCHAPKNTTSTFVTPPPSGYTCRDYEQDSILCVYLDLFDMCTSRTKLSLVVASEKCPRHCGYCHDTTTTLQTEWPCLDLEASPGQCAQLKAGGHCLPVEGTNYETAKLRCRKTCHYC